MTELFKTAAAGQKQNLAEAPYPSKGLYKSLVLV